MKTKKFYEPIFRTTVLFLHGTHTELDLFIKNNSISLEKNSDGFDGWVVPYHINKKNGSVDQGLFVFVNVARKQMQNLSHECVHVACEIMSWCGIPITYENQETLAYIQLYWFTKLLDVMYPLKKLNAHNRDEISNQ